MVVFFLSMANMLYAQTTSIEWVSWPQLNELMKKQKKKVIVDIYNDRCGWCKRMDATTFSDPIIVRIINKDYYAVKFNSENREDIEYKNKVYKYVNYGNKGCHQLALEITQGNLSFPTFVFMDENLDIIQPIPGYLDSPTFEIIAAYFRGNHHKTTPFQIFEESYKNNSKNYNNKPVGNR